MIKKVYIYGLMFFCSVWISAEEMQFVTTLSSPMGTFAMLETANPKKSVSAQQVNFCNTRSTVGRIDLKGANAYLQNLTLKNGTSLEGNVKEYRVGSSLNVNAGGRVTARRLMANTVSLSSASDAESEVNNTLYISSMSVKGAKAGSLEIPGQVKTSGTGDGEDMHWSNEYTRDYTSSGSATGSSYSSYLLKSSASICEPPREESYYDYSCPSGYEGYRWYVWDYYSCEYEIRDECQVKKKYIWKRQDWYDQNPDYASPYVEQWVVDSINGWSCQPMIDAGVVPSNLHAVALSGCSSTECGSCSGSQGGNYGFAFYYPVGPLCRGYICQQE